MLKKTPVLKKIIIAVLVLIPILVGFYFWNYIRETERAAAGLLLSPIDNTPIIVTLIIFMAGYLLFLFIMFYDNIKEYTHKAVK
mgnify:CR=1 FL=1|tara:strand:+ start:739 stop:990 length:252 start_codon:yes stop_codon:yes gene_type:complete